MLATIILIVMQFLPVPNPNPAVIFNGNWQSCREANGYSERAYDHCILGKCDWTFHLGPMHEFALYPYPGLEGDHDHNTKENLLYPDYTVYEHARTWRVPKFHLQVKVSEAGGSRPECESFFVEIKKE